MDEMNHRFVYSDALKHEQNESEKARMEIGNGNRVLRQREGDQRHRMLDELCVRAISPKCYELIRTDKMKWNEMENMEQASIIYCYSVATTGNHWQHTTLQCH